MKSYIAESKEEVESLTVSSVSKMVTGYKLITNIGLVFVSDKDMPNNLKKGIE